MLLKRLEMQGFKSFADKTVLDLNSKIVGVVGPNGSGKSNVTDAIRWLLGERDARNLRGGKVDDLIFAGNEKRPRLGLAQAALYFDNSSGFLPVDFNEVSISRRVTRDGESKYFINKSEVRLKDVVDFFAKAKLGARGLTIINQGSSDMFIKATPIERREMIEEILGLKEYQIKKTDSIRKLKNSSINLEQVNASLEELKPHLRFLKRQVARYEGRDEMVKELSDLEDAFYGRRLKSLDEEVAGYRASLEGFADKISEQNKVASDLEVKFLEVKNSEPDAAKDYHVIEEDKSKLQKEKSDLQRELGRIEAQLEFASKPAPSPELVDVVREVRDIATLSINETDIESLKNKIKEIISKIDMALNPSTTPSEVKNEDKVKFKALSDEILTKLKSIDEKLSSLSEKEESVRAKLGSFNKDFSAAYELFESAKKKLVSLRDEESRIKFSIEKVNLRRDNILDELKQINRSPESLKSVGEINMSEDEMQSKMFRLRGTLASIGEVDENLVKEARETEERFDYLSGQYEDIERAIEDLKSLIKELDEKLHTEFKDAIKKINSEFDKLMKLTFGGGKARLIIKDIPGKRPVVNDDADASKLEEEEEEDMNKGIEIEITLPRKRVSGLDVLSGGERTLVSIAVLFSLVSVSPPPFIVLDEVDAALDEGNAKRFADILKEFSKHTQFVLITHNRATMEAADVLYGVTMGNDGVSKLLSLNLQDAN